MRLSRSIRSLFSICREAIRLVQTTSSPGGNTSLGRSRYVRAARTAMTSGLNTILTTTLGIFSIALTIRYLGIERYGLWLTISTILAWLSLTDFGVGNALTNKLSASHGQGREQEARHYVATAFWLLSLIGLLITVTGAVLGFALPWGSLLNVKSAQAAQELPLAIALSFAIYGLGFPLGITKNIYSGYQEGYYANYWNVAASVVSLLALVAVTRFGAGLPLLVAAVFGARLVVLAASSVFLFGFHRRALAPAPRAARRADVRSLFSLGFMFIALQLAGLLISQTDNLVIVRMLGPEDVAVYGTLWRLFSYVSVVQMWVLVPLWPAYGEAYARADVRWIRRTLRLSVIGLLVFTTLLSGVLAIFARDIIRVWVGPDLMPSLALVLSVALLQVVWAWTQPFTIFLNGISRLRGQVVYGLATALVAIVLKVILVPHLGLLGVINSTIIAYLLLAVWLLPLDAWYGLRWLSLQRERALVTV